MLHPLLHTFFSDTWTGSLEEQQPPGDVRDKPKEDIPGANCLPEILLRLSLASQSHHASKGIQDLSFHPSRFPILLNGITTPAAATAAKSLQSCPTLRPYRRQPTRLPRPWDSPGKNTGVGCHFLLQCMKVKSESEVAQLCLTLSNPMDCSLPGSSGHGIFEARVLEWGAIAFSTCRH